MTSVQQGARSRGRAEDAGPDEGGDEQDEQRSDQQQGGGRQGSAGGGRSSLVKNKHIIEEFINVGVPHKVAYDQWTQYHEWSKIFKKESAKAGDGKGSGDGDDDENNEVTVTAKIGPSQREWRTEVVAQRPGRRIEWEAQGGVKAKGVVTFHRLDDRLTHLQCVIEYQPSGFFETVGNFFRMQRRRVRKDLKLFKNFIDLRGEASGEGPGAIGGSGLQEGMDQQLEERMHGDDEEQDQDEQDQGEQDQDEQDQDEQGSSEREGDGG